MIKENTKKLKILLFLAVFFVGLGFLCSIASATDSGSKETTNFIVQVISDNPSVKASDFASKIGDLAEKYRKEQAMEWFYKCLSNRKSGNKDLIYINVKPDNSSVRSMDTEFLETKNNNNASYRQIRITASSANIEANLPKAILQSNLIEFLGIKSNSELDSVPFWFMEGAGLMETRKNLSPEKIQKMKQTLYSAISEPYHGFSFDNLLNISRSDWAKLSPEQRLLFWYQSESIVDFLTQLQCFGKRTLVSLIGEKQHSNITWNNLFPKVYKTNIESAPYFKSTADLQEQWRQWVINGRIRKDAPEPGKPAGEQMKPRPEDCRVDPTEEYPSPTERKPDPVPPPNRVNPPAVKPIPPVSKIKVFVIRFWATWCGPCMAMDKGYYEAKSQIQNREANGNYNIETEFKEVEVKTWNSSEATLLRRYGESSIPTVVFEKNGKHIVQKQMTKNQIIEMIDFLNNNEITPK